MNNRYLYGLLILIFGIATNITTFYLTKSHYEDLLETNKKELTNTIKSTEEKLRDELDTAVQELNTNIEHKEKCEEIEENLQQLKSKMESSKKSYEHYLDEEILKDRVPEAKNKWEDTTREYEEYLHFKTTEGC